MNNKNILYFEIMTIRHAIHQIVDGNLIVAKRWFSNGYTLENMITETNDLISKYNKKYGKRFGIINSI